MNRCTLPVAVALALGLGACAPAADEAATDAAAPATPATQAAPRTIAVVPEAFRTAMTPEDNIDSVASWTTPEGGLLLLATAKATDQLVAYDGETGASLARFGREGDAPGEYRRPNGIAVVDDLAFVVERDGRRVQVLQLPGLVPLGHFGADVLRKPYGLWVLPEGEGRYTLYVTDAYMAGEDAQGEDILPPLEALDQRVHRFAVQVADGRAEGKAVAAFGDTGPEGALRVVESLWGDPQNDRLLVAEEDESYANELKVYDLAGRYAGRVIGREVFAAQAEGIMLRTCAGGSGWWITTEQGKSGTVFHLFDRNSLEHAGAVAGTSVANTDGIWLHAAPSARFPEGVLYAVHDDQGAVALDWREIRRALSLPACPAP